jgi:hypothetical protein
MSLRKLGVLALGSALLGTPGVAGATQPSGPARLEKPAAAQATVELLVLHATNAKRGIDARLKDLPELTKAPFSAYDSYTIADQAKLVLDKSAPKTRNLPNGRVLQARLLEVTGDDSVRLSASINQPGGADFLPLLEVKARFGQRFIVAGQRHKSGILVLVMRVSK